MRKPILGQRQWVFVENHTVSRILFMLMFVTVFFAPQLAVGQSASGTCYRYHWSRRSKSERGSGRRYQRS
jgi:hypothetical protein